MAVMRRDRRQLRFGIIGAGMAGILSAIELKEAGLTDFTVYEKGDRVGGTWRENTYPGLACDVPSHLYSYSFRLNPDWSHLYSPGAEIQAYFEQVAREYGIGRYIRFNDEIVRCSFVDGRWHLVTANGHRDVVDVVIAATGVLHHPRYPDIDGMDSFAGAVFHSARWPQDVRVEGARLGIIGTGSTAVQMVTALVDRVAHLVLFQRTAQWVMPQSNPPYTPDDKRSFRDEPGRLGALYAKLSELFDTFASGVVDASSPQMQTVAEACRANLEDNVKDPQLRERLRPNYQAACKRLIAAENFYGAIQNPNAELVTERIACIEPRGVRTHDGRLHELDVLVLATGFRVDAFMRPMVVTGRGGTRLDDVWRRRPNAYLSISIPDFPNFFMLNGPNGPVGNFSLIGVAELQFGYIMQLIDGLTSGTGREISATHQAMEQHEAARVEATKHTVWATGCRSWYLDDRGVPATWPWPFDRFREEMAAPKMDAFELVE
jgi:cation diffusion facilitator CzcD-associated flavoprotein CzcO